MKTNDQDVNDWFDDLTDEQQQSVDRALLQLEGGEGIPHEEAIKLFGLI
jgi:hypothetical protein